MSDYASVNFLSTVKVVWDEMYFRIYGAFIYDVRSNFIGILFITMRLVLWTIKLTSWQAKDILVMSAHIKEIFFAT